MPGLCACMSFNSQPPEGGWERAVLIGRKMRKFQLTAARRRLGDNTHKSGEAGDVSTHSRPKAAGRCVLQRRRLAAVSTHSRPKAAGRFLLDAYNKSGVSTHSRPKAAGGMYSGIGFVLTVSTHSRPKAAGRCASSDAGFKFCFNSQPPEGGWASLEQRRMTNSTFQLTAARRRLVEQISVVRLSITVSTHSRPKAAGCKKQNVLKPSKSFNSQPPEGGWKSEINV